MSEPTTYCLECKHLKVDLTELAAARLVPSTELEVRCIKKSLDSIPATGTFKRLKVLNKNKPCYIPREEE